MSEVRLGDTNREDYIMNGVIQSDTRTEQPSNTTYSSSFNERNDSRMSRSGYSREGKNISNLMRYSILFSGSAIHSSSSYSGRTVENDSNW